jgi:hypothetical protein
MHLALSQFFKSSRDEKVATTQAGLPAVGRQVSKTLECGRH